jgi:signal transduction histidine kinase/ActR/RegA family two-component response regulator
MPREPSPGELLQHTTQLLSLTSPREILIHTCREALDVTGGVIAFGSHAVPGQPWDRGIRVMVPGGPGAVPQAAVSALFAIHRRLSTRREPLTLERSSETAAIFDALAPAPGRVPGVIHALPILHRTGRMLGEIAIAAEQPDGLAGESTRLVPDLARLASAALESAQKLALARKDQERLHLLAEASDEVLWDWNLDTQEFWWGGGVQKLVGAGGGGVQNKASWKLERIHPCDRARVEASFERALRSASEPSWREEYRVPVGDASIVIEDRGYFLRESNGRAYRVVGAMRDITPLKALLEREQHARAEAEQASRAKDEFLAMLGHELRNPLAPILTALDLLRIRGSAGSATIEREWTIIERQTRHMVRLVDDLLDVSRIATGKIEIQTQRVELAEIVAKAIEMASPIIEERRHHLQAQVPARGLPVDADPARLAQVVCNLLTNAAKYTEPAGRITITAARSAGSVEIEVLDTGVGIAPEMLPHVFDMFVQERQSLARSRGGLGLGLSIVRSLVALHGGTVEARSQGRGHGSRFTVRLPLAMAHPADAAGQHGLPDAGASSVTPARDARRILIVDDNEDAALLLAEYLEARGNVTDVAHDGPAALRVALEFAPDIVLLDLGLPLMDGYEVARRLRERAGHDRLRLVAVTGYGQENDRRQAEAAGFDAHMVKPVSIDRLEQTIRALTQNAR